MANEDGALGPEEKFTQALNDVKALMVTIKEKGDANGGILDQLKERVQKAEAQAEANKTAFEARVAALELEKNRPNLGVDTAKALPGLAEMLAGNEQFKAYVEGAKSSNPGRSNPFELKSLLDTVVAAEHKRRNRINTKGLVVGSDGLGDGLVNPYRVPMMAEAATRPLTIFEIIPRMSAMKGLIEYIQETAFHEISVDIASSASSGQKNIVVDNSRGFYAGQTVVVAYGTAAQETHVLASVTHSTNTLTTTNNLANTHAADITVTSSTFAGTAEEGLKPNIGLVTDLIQIGTKMIAHGVDISRQLVRDADNFMAYLERRLPIGLFTEAERMIINGNGDSAELAGFLRAASGTWPGLTAYLWSSGEAGDNMLDAIVRGANVATLSHYPASHFLIHPTDLTKIRLKKGNDGHYIDIGRLGEWNLMPIPTTAIAVGTAIVGSFDFGCTLWESDAASVQVFDQHKDMAQRNQLYVRAEMGLGLSIELPSSFVKVTFDSQP